MATVPEASMLLVNGFSMFAVAIKLTTAYDSFSTIQSVPNTGKGLKPCDRLLAVLFFSICVVDCYGVTFCILRPVYSHAKDPHNTNSPAETLIRVTEVGEVSFL